MSYLVHNGYINCLNPAELLKITLSSFYMLTPLLYLKIKYIIRKIILHLQACNAIFLLLSSPFLSFYSSLIPCSYSSYFIVYSLSDVLLLSQATVVAQLFFFPLPIWGDKTRFTLCWWFHRSQQDNRKRPIWYVVEGKH